MATNYPAAKDDNTTLPNPSAGNATNSPSHASQHANVNDAVKALETKTGTGASVPAANTLLIGTGPGTSSWSQLTSAQLAAILSDETGSGSAVFANTPVLITPKIDTINENTTNNGVVIDGVLLKDGTVATANSIVTAALANASVTPSKLATGALAALIATSESTTSTSFVDLATVGPTVSSISIGANGIALVGLSCKWSNNTGTGENFMGFAISGATTQAASDSYSIMTQAPGNNYEGRMSGVFLVTGLTPGVTTFKAQYKMAVGGTATFVDRRLAVVPL